MGEFPGNFSKRVDFWREELPRMARLGECCCWGLLREAREGVSSRVMVRVLGVEVVAVSLGIEGGIGWWVCWWIGT